MFCSPPVLLANLDERLRNPGSPGDPNSQIARVEGDDRTLKVGLLCTGRQDFRGRSAVELAGCEGHALGDPRTGYRCVEPVGAALGDLDCKSSRA